MALVAVYVYARGCTGDWGRQLGLGRYWVELGWVGYVGEDKLIGWGMLGVGGRVSISLSLSLFVGSCIV